MGGRGAQRFALIGAALVPTLQRFSLRALSLVSLLVMAASYPGMGTSGTILTVTAWSFVGGLGNGVEGFAVMTLVQERTPAALQARVNGLLESLHAIVPGIGFLVGGIIATSISPRAAYLVAGLGALAVVTAIAWTLYRPARATVPAADVATDRPQDAALTA